MVSNSSVVPLLNWPLPVVVVKTSVQSVTFVAAAEAPANEGVQDFVTEAPVNGLTGVGGTTGLGGQTCALPVREVRVVPAVTPARVRSTVSQRLAGPMMAMGGRV